MALTERDLKKHISDCHGDFYIHMGKGRNILRLCRVCPDTERWQSDQELTAHINQAHPPTLYANAECESILPESQKIPVLLNRAPQPITR